jgi:hypothetical protein
MFSPKTANALNVAVHGPTESDPMLLECTMSETQLETISASMEQHTGSTIYELAELNPRDAYIRLYHLFRANFIDPTTEDWDIGTPEEDGQQAFDGLTQYVEERRAPDPDIEEIDLVLSVWKRGDVLNFLRGDRRVPEEVLRFRVEPPDLVSS